MSLMSPTGVEIFLKATSTDYPMDQWGFWIAMGQTLMRYFENEGNDISDLEDVREFVEDMTTQQEKSLSIDEKVNIFTTLYWLYMRQFNNLTIDQAHNLDKIRTYLFLMLEPSQEFIEKELFPYYNKLIAEASKQQEE